MLQVVQEVNGRVGVSKELKIEETTALSFSSALPAIYACPNRHTA